MSTRVLHLDSPKIDKATSGAYYLLFNNGGHTGNLVLDGAAYVNYINASGLAVQNNLTVTGSQTTHGNATFFSFNNSANLSVTGSAYINNLTGSTRFNDIHVTGDTVISGDIGHYGNFNSTGTTNITGSLYVNGVQITGMTSVIENTNVFITGDIGSLITGRGDILVGTGNSGYARFHTGGAISGQFILFDPSRNPPLRWSSGSSSSSLGAFPTGGLVAYESTYTGDGIQGSYYTGGYPSDGGFLLSGFHKIKTIKSHGRIRRCEVQYSPTGDAQDIIMLTDLYVNGVSVATSSANAVANDLSRYGSITSLNQTVIPGDVVGLSIMQHSPTSPYHGEFKGPMEISLLFTPSGNFL